MTFTEKYFREEICRLRTAWGNKDFWQKTDEQRERMLDGIRLVYLNIENEDGSKPTTEQIENWAGLFEATMFEYERRKMYVNFHPAFKGLAKPE
jgi:hypothetical protein